MCCCRIYFSYTFIKTLLLLLFSLSCCFWYMYILWTSEQINGRLFWLLFECRVVTVFLFRKYECAHTHINTHTFINTKGIKIKWASKSNHYSIILFLYINNNNNKEKKTMSSSAVIAQHKLQSSHYLFHLKS